MQPDALGPLPGPGRGLTLSRDDGSAPDASAPSTPPWPDVRCGGESMLRGASLFSGEESARRVARERRRMVVAIHHCFALPLPGADDRVYLLSVRGAYAFKVVNIARSLLLRRQEPPPLSHGASTASEASGASFSSAAAGARRSRCRRSSR